MKAFRLLALFFVLSFASCKKDKDSAQNLIEFDSRGRHYTLTTEGANIRYYLNGGKSISIWAHTDNGFNVTLFLHDDISDPASQCILTSDYTRLGYDTCVYDSMPGNCSGFRAIYYFDGALGIFLTELNNDDFTALNVTSCDGSLHINGTFQAAFGIGDDTANVSHFTNGKITDVRCTWY